MNDLIQQLIKHATTVEHGVIVPRAVQTVYHFDKKKFAELIIQECIKQAGDPADGLIFGNTWHDGVRASVQSIKQHFGVES